MPHWSFVKKTVLIFLFALLYGSFVEICQEQFTATRKADIYDVIANVTGSVIAILILVFVEKFQKEKRN